MVGPTKANPRRFRSFEMTVESAVCAGNALPVPRDHLRFVNDQQSAPKSSPESCISQKIPAMVASILALAPDDPRIVHEAINVTLGEARDQFGVEACERLSECLALSQHDDPRQAGLKALQHQHFPQSARIAL